MICTYFGVHWPLVLLCWISPDTSISKRERVRSGRDVIYWFLIAANLLLTQRKKWEQLFFGDKIPHLESIFWKLGCVPVLRSLIRILRASLVQIDTEIIKKILNQRYAVDRPSLHKHQYTKCPIQPDIRPESRFLLTPPAFDASVRGHVYSFWHDPRTWQTDGQTDRQTDTAWRHYPRLCIASLGKTITVTVHVHVCWQLTVSFLSRSPPLPKSVISICSTRSEERQESRGIDKSPSTADLTAIQSTFEGVVHVTCSQKKSSLIWLKEI